MLEIAPDASFRAKTSNGSCFAIVVNCCEVSGFHDLSVCAGTVASLLVPCVVQ